MRRANNKTFYRVFGAGMLLLSAGLIALTLWSVFRTPPLPAGWPAVRPGMTRLEVWQAAYPGRPYPWSWGNPEQETSGGVMLNEPYRALCWSGHWQMQVIYGDDGRAEEVATKYFGPFGKSSFVESPSRGRGWNVQRR